MGFLKSLSEGFSGCKRFRVVTAHNGEEALRVLSMTAVDLLVTDLVMPVMDGFELIRVAKRDYPWIPVIVISAYLEHNAEARLQALGIDHYLEKPLDFDEIATAIKNKVSSASGQSESEVLVP